MTNPAERHLEREQDFSLFLQVLYELQDGDPWAYQPASTMAERLGWDLDKVHAVGHELHRRGAVEIPTMGPTYAITDYGAEALETAVLAGPEDGDLRPLVERLQEDRRRLLWFIYDSASGEVQQPVKVADAESVLGLGRMEVHHLIKWLRDRGLVDAWTNDSVYLTPYGIDRIEVAEATNEPAAAGVAPLHVVEVHNSPGANVNVIQGSPGATIYSVSVDTDRVTSLKELLARIAEELDLDEEGTAAIGEIESEVGKGKADSPVVHRALARLGSFALSAGSSAVGNLIFAFMAGAPPF